MVGRVQKFTLTGDFPQSWFTLGIDNGEFREPYAIGSNTRGQVYFCDRGNHCVQWFTSDGAYLGQLGIPGTGPGQFSFPHGIAVDAAGLVHVADSANHRIQTFAPA